jgi:hypothetical protein
MQRLHGAKVVVLTREGLAGAATGKEAEHMAAASVVTQK